MTDTIKISIRLTKDELAEIDRRAKSQNLSRNEYIKICAFSEDALNKTKALAFAPFIVSINLHVCLCIQKFRNADSVALLSSGTFPSFKNSHNCFS